MLQKPSLFGDQARFIENTNSKSIIASIQNPLTGLAHHVRDNPVKQASGLPYSNKHRVANFLDLHCHLKYITLVRPKEMGSSIVLLNICIFQLPKDSTPPYERLIPPSEQ
uniref:MPN domain-containing protein n=1 Tax=Heterorhabditis bacteriophora TaxID=37862 RepID=A0A1I7W9Y9_HETBA